MDAEISFKVWVVDEPRNLVRLAPITVTCLPGTSVEQATEIIATKLKIHACDCALFLPLAKLVGTLSGRGRLQEALGDHPKDYLMDESKCIWLGQDDQVPIESVWRTASTRQGSCEEHVSALIVLVSNMSMTMTNDTENTDADKFGESPLWSCFNKVLSLSNTGVPPSARAQPQDYLAHQDSDSPLFDGRSGLKGNPCQAVPVEAYHWAFARFSAGIKNETEPVPADLVVQTAQFMKIQSKIATSESTRTETRTQLSLLLDFPITSIMTSRGIVADHSIPGFSDSIREIPLIVVVEEEGELATSGEPTVQASFSYVSSWSDPSRNVLARASFCPSFIIGIAGPWLCVCGAIFTTHVVVRRLTDYLWIGDSGVIDDHLCLRLARIFHSLRSALSHLSSFYHTLRVDREPAEFVERRFYPLATSCRLKSRVLRFRYVRHLKSLDPSCTTFLVREEENGEDGEENREDDAEDEEVNAYVPGRQLVVKFVERYSPDAHKLLAQHGLAPKLLYHGPIWPPSVVPGVAALPHKMVVMEYVVGGETAAKVFAGKHVPQDVRNALRRAQDLLEENGLVHGDIRLPNIVVVVADGRGGLAGRTRIIDFEWAGRAGDVRYPLHLSHEGVAWGDYDLITPAHDKYMIDNLR